MCSTPVKTGLPESFIIGGNPAPDYETSVAAIVSFQEHQATFGFLFTGSLITNQHILTVAQAIQGYVNWHVGLGSIDRDAMQYFESSTVHIHDQYNPQFLQNNIGIIVLHEAIPPIVALPMTLPPEHPTLSPMYRYYGFGLTDPNDFGSAAYRLKYGFTSQVSLEECRNIFGSLLITNGTWCGQQFNTGLCHGDQGGPMIHFFDNHLVAIGSHWMDPCHGGFPDVFVNVSYYLSWIYQIINAPIPVEGL
uniref:Putative trypsin-like serine protease n=1 Tax=Lutzomyia longipalpis TaxID=7200 RepID=A0A1B0GKR7_LUTLO